MMLLVDAGNTRVKWALVADHAALGAWQAHGAQMHADLGRLAPDWLAALAGAAQQGAEQARAARDSTAQEGTALTRVMISNVAGGIMRARLEDALAAIAAPAAEWFASVPERAGVVNGYRNPGQLGCDRFAAAIGAHALAPGRDLVVANCGTATTIDAITADGRFLGGMILPGVGLMAASLARNTAQLPQIAQGGKLPDGFADNTDDAILSGCLAAQGGAIEHACRRHGAAECILSGGAAPWVAPALGVRYRQVENIVLIGLHAACRGA